MFKNVELFYEPRDILEKTSEKYCEMTLEDHAFLCGLIRKKKPRKIVEIGVAGGGTTCVIMKCLENVSPDAKMYSCDINKQCYRRKDKATGFELSEVRAELSNYKNHTFMLGGILPEFVEKIGGEIDFCVLDTIHSLPGEFLDFLAILPYLSHHATVVLHDVALHLIGKSNIAYATKLLFDSVVAEKYYNIEEGIYNIAAFSVDENTRKYIANVFSALSISWYYEPSIKQLMIYRDEYKKHYDKECLTLFDLFWNLNHERMKNQKI